MFTIYHTDCDGENGPEVQCATLAEAMGHLEEALEDNHNFPMYRDEAEGHRPPHAPSSSTSMARTN